MTKNKTIFIALCFTLIVNQSAYAYGSYLFCSNSTASESGAAFKGLGWNWAKGTNNSNNNPEKTPIDDYPHLTKVFSNGTWIGGTADLSTKNSYYLLINNTFENRDAAINFCEALKQKCQNDWGENFTGVGASTWDIPRAAWGSIAVKYKTQPNNRNEWLACKNWDHKHYEPLFYTPAWVPASAVMVGIIATGACVASGICPEFLSIAAL